MRTDIIEKIPEIEKRLSTEKTTIAALAREYNISAPTLRKYLGINSKKRELLEDLIGKQFANRIILSRDYNPPFKSHETAFQVQCLDCDKIYTVRKSDILKKCPYCVDVLVGRGHKDIHKGDIFGYLEVIKEEYNYETASPKVFCRCECGIEKWVAIKNLKRTGQYGRTISCGCKQKSSGEIQIAMLLDIYNIPYIEQYFIDDFSKHSAFDFAIFDKDKKLIGLIEYDGEQHFFPVACFGGEEKFVIQQKRDTRKNNYCEEKGIKLLRIPYTDFNKINLEYLLVFFPELKKIIKS